jgi:hypothetical protein
MMKLEPSKKKDTFVGYRVSHMEIDSEEHMDPPLVMQVVSRNTISK